MIDTKITAPAGPRERPILFSAPMVRALLDGSKTQTRRVVKDLPSWDITEIVQSASDCGRWLPNGPAPSGRGMASGHWRPCPYGQPGDRLWVRETFTHLGEGPLGIQEIEYRADGECDPNVVPRWTPSIHMPRWASRIVLEITGVRVERLQAIGDSDVRAEGVERVADVSPVDSFQSLWESINGADSWAAHPWVWVVEFKRVRL